MMRFRQKTERSNGKGEPGGMLTRCLGVVQKRFNLEIRDSGHVTPDTRAFSSFYDCQRWLDYSCCRPSRYTAGKFYYN
ncbi:hypothetical protein ERO13_D08G132900v2 [Gossypium hirsutum]|uniref:Uncharacterized protein n=2 Tax=Gossypium TaxID=3633 RepID=A0A5D2JWY3_GOSTO|nr:hypothetical protein ERO13_D08G132900v2 [Gossypium hirsutum]TYG57531.1 hypothetical protein ES288_D08G150100v1 [Gossypium darwinii]TYH58313.1 hypothetical protein ES332_D08G145600v1 [Gossypium tomentosum]